MSPKLRILARTRALLSEPERSLQRSGVKYSVQGIRALKERREVKDFVSFWSWFRNPKDTDALTRCMRAYKSGIGPKSISDNRIVLTDMSAMIAAVDTMPPKIKAFIFMVIRINDCKTFPEQVLEFMWFMYGIKTDDIKTSSIILLLLSEDEHDGEDSKDRADTLLFIVESIAEERLTLDEFLDDYALNPDKEKVEDAEIVLQTIHSAKGLEADYVIVIGFSQGLLPHSGSRYDDAQLEEERRLAFVAMSRAKKGVYLLHAKMRFHYGEVVYYNKSEFLKDIEVS